jgi:predicted SprT family Zn-dependent metalloprotease
MLEFKISPSKKAKQKEELYELACECTTVRLNEKEASKIIEEMTVCKGCKKPVYLVI